jgi:hypothetical protein
MFAGAMVDTLAGLSIQSGKPEATAVAGFDSGELVGGLRARFLKFASRQAQNWNDGTDAEHERTTS